MAQELATSEFSSEPLPIKNVLACGDCDLLHKVSATTASLACIRCDGQLADGGLRHYDRAMAIVIACLLLFSVVCFEPLLTVSEQGMTRVDYLISGPLALAEYGLWPLAPVVLFFSLVAPLMRFVALTYVMGAMRWQRSASRLPLMMKLAELLRPWSMLDVFVIGGFVAYTRLNAIVTVSIGAGGWAMILLVALTFVMDDIIAHQLVWRNIPFEHRESARVQVDAWHRVTCPDCHLVMELAPPADEEEESPLPHCPRCDTKLTRRKTNSIARTWAMVLGAAVFYIPANFLPVMTVVRFGNVESDTILSGVKALIEAQMWSLAGIVFMASIAVPMLKLTGLTLLLLSTHFKWHAHLDDRTKLYRVIDIIGRWSNIDVFMVSILAALVQFGNLTEIRPGPGILPFALVVLITMFAAHSFDPRLMWDEGGAQDDSGRKVVAKSGQKISSQAGSPT